jgi:hypothetical protein
MRSTWVRTIRLQQYRLSCSSSRASLDKPGGETGIKWKRKNVKDFAESVVAGTYPSDMSFARRSR